MIARSLDRPYEAAARIATAEAMEREGRMPRGLSRLMAWYAEAWAAEVPDRLHLPGVWRDYGLHAAGASALGSPRYADDFRNYLEASPFQVDPDGRYVRPVHAALALVTGRDPDSERAYHGRYLFRLACSGFDWRATASRAAIPPAVQAPYTEFVVGRLWRRYSPMPALRIA